MRSRIFLTMLLSYSTCLLLSCSNRASTNAYIFERKKIDGDQLMIKYKYLVNGKEFKDSTTVKNQVLNSDTITVQYDKNEPGNSTTALQK